MKSIPYHHGSSRLHHCTVSSPLTKDLLLWEAVEPKARRALHTWCVPSVVCGGGMLSSDDISIFSRM
jgi:hypothetical protein